MGRKPLAVILSLAAVVSIGGLTLAAASARGTGTAGAPSGAGDGLGFTRVSRPAPPFALPRLSGPGDITVGRLAGRAIVVNFWASTCSVCRHEEPAIAQVARATRGRVSFAGIDTLDSRGAARTFARRYGLTFPLAFDSRGVAASRYGVPGLPETFFLSAGGQRIIGINVGALTGPALTSILRQLYGIS
jgi:cytochrome c biogenesis protein CcmG, thiol:disulfide interchange protein DsbE